VAALPRALEALERHAPPGATTKLAGYAGVGIAYARWYLAGVGADRLGAALATLRAALADLGGYACVLSHAGPDALSVTTNISINFMRKAGPGPVDGRCRILKLGRSLMVYDIEMTAGPEAEIVAHATGTYSIPPRRG